MVRCHSEPEHSGGEESRLSTEEILYCVQDDVIPGVKFFLIEWRHAPGNTQNDRIVKRGVE